VALVDWRDARFRLVTGFFERIYAPLLLLFVLAMALGLVVWLGMTVL
jgi:hypothetical protein